MNMNRLIKNHLRGIRSGFAAVMCVATLAGCSALVPVGVSSNVAARGPSIESFPEHFVYRIDAHRYITIQGTKDCAGRIYFYNTQTGIRTAVATTGMAVGSGIFSGYYAAQSEYVAIPAIGYSEISGPLLYVYYSYDGGKTFKRFLAGGYGGERDVVILDGKNLYFGANSSDPSEGIYQAYLMDVSHDIATGDDHFAIRSERPEIEPSRVPVKLKSPSGETRWTCSASPRD